VTNRRLEMVTKSNNRELFNAQTEIEELSMQLADMLGAALYFAGVKKSKLKDGVEAYLDAIDEVVDEDEVVGYEEVIKIIEHLKRTKQEIFIDA
jgi:hypothetical protein